MNYHQTEEKNNWLRPAFYTIWLLLSFIQAYSTELLADEAYYWKYAQHLSWGYFDHPPMVAVLIKAGWAQLQNELGVRVIFAITFTLSLYVVELLVHPAKLLHYYLSIASIGVFHFVGFLALPDIPLLFFTVTFLYFFRKYLEKDDWLLVLALGVNAALLLLSKYHGILIIGFAVLANIRLLKRPTFWVITVLCVILFLPHLAWQDANGWPSVRYHLLERSTEPYNISFTLNYLLSVIIILAPFTGLVLAWHTIKTRPVSHFDRTLKTIAVGTMLFFFLATFKGRAEANWMIMAVIPFFILGYRHLEDLKWFPGFNRTAFIVSMVLICLGRVFLIYDYLPDNKAFGYVKETLHHTKSWARSIKNKAGDKPVVFMNKYQYAAWYEYYTGKKAISLNNRMGRKNQYNLWLDEQDLQGKNIMLVPNFDMNMDIIHTRKGNFQYCYIDNFHSASDVVISIHEKTVTTQVSKPISLHFSFSCNYNWNHWDNKDFLPVLHIVVFDKRGHLVSDINTGVTLPQSNKAVSKGVNTITTPHTLEKGNYIIYADVAPGWLPPGISSNAATLTVN